MDLNDDCWILIFCQLSLKDQISAALAYQRFRNILTTFWQRKLLKFSVRCHFVDTKEQLHVLMESICGTVESMDLGCLTFEKWHVIKSYSYPNLKTLCMLHPHPSSDECILEMTKVFPNLYSFYPNSPDISGKHIEKWQKLNDLSFFNCENVQFIYFENIFKELHLKSIDLGIFDNENCNFKWTSDEAFENFCKLENISICSDELVWLSNLSLFSNLKTLELFDIANDALVFQLLKYIANKKCDDLIELNITIHFPLHILLVRAYANLSKITFLWRDNTGFNYVLKYASNLREVIIKESKGLQEEDVYVWFKSDKLEFLSIERCQCMFTNLRLNVEDIVCNRTKLLHFNFHGNEIDGRKVNLELNNNNSLFQITYENLNPDWMDSNRFRFR